MFHAKWYHLCSLQDKDSDDHLPVLSPMASVWEKLKRRWKKLILVTDKNRHSVLFYRSKGRITDELKAQIASGSWIIHPFSTFRLYYDMYMGVVLFVCLIHMPLYASYHFLLGHALLYSHNFLCVLCIIDIVMTFLTGMCLSEDVVMDPKRIAKGYIFSRYFICDLLSSVPDYGATYKDYGVAMIREQYIMDYLALLKIVRIGTYNTYLERILTNFRIEGLESLLIKLALLAALVVHYVDCFLYFMQTIHIYLDTENIQMDVGQHQNLTDFYRFYSKFMYQGASYILKILTIFSKAVDTSVDFTLPPAGYFFTIFAYVMGRILVAFFIVVLLDVFKLTNHLSVKYQEMMSQVSDYMAAKAYPPSVQNSIILYYEYRYYKKYVSEKRIEKYLSDKLKSQIRLFECRKLFNSVTIFRGLPPEIMEKVIVYMKREHYMPGETIIRAGTVGECMYFIASGTVSVVSPSGKEICHLQDGDYFGELCLLTTSKRTATVTTLEHCELYRLEKRHFRMCFENQQEILKHMGAEAKQRYAQVKNIERHRIKPFATQESD